MNLRRSLHTNKGYTLIELMITLFIFAIITMFGVPAFYDFIEQSRAKSQMIKAANFLRSAQEIAIASNRTVFVYTAGYFDYGMPNNDDQNYWYKDWIMSFKPIGQGYLTTTPQDIELRTGDEGSRTANPNYLITQQPIFTPSNVYTLNILDSAIHNAVDTDELMNYRRGPEMEGYSRVRATLSEDGIDQGSVKGKPTYMMFYPSGDIIMPIFVISKQGFDHAFDSTDYGTQWQNELNPSERDEDMDNDNIFVKPFGILAGCRMAGGVTINSVNYTFRDSLINGKDGDIEIFSHEDRNRTSGSAPSFNHALCGTRALQ